MIRFLLGEHRHVKYFVHANPREYFVVKRAQYQLIYKGVMEACGECNIDQDDDGVYLDIMLQPKNRSHLYVLEITLDIADETIMYREEMEVS